HGNLEKIAEIEKEILEHRKTKVRGRSLPSGLLKAKLAKYRAQLLEPPSQQGQREGFDVMKSGDARVALIGFPSVGKLMTSTESEAASYEFTTLTAYTGVIEVHTSTLKIF
uniref:Developmentally regulated GTP binding protein 2 n=1 Tax=Maylandia zebra TaxID=106582 RepID=A0A3P9DU41_9CICH